MIEGEPAGSLGAGDEAVIDVAAVEVRPSDRHTDRRAARVAPGEWPPDARCASHPPRRAGRPARSGVPGAKPGAWVSVGQRDLVRDGQGAGNGVTGKPGGGAPGWIRPTVSAVEELAGTVPATA